ncbi:MAG TPA: phage integrase N-terminal SAM-like domain-containing protein [Pyrinomonadaceae bacterium]
MSQLLGEGRDAVRTRHYSIRTEEAYLRWIREYILFFGKRHPAELGAKNVSAFLSHLAVERKVAASTQNQALSALLFLYREVLALPIGWVDDIERAKRPKRLPVVLTREEVRAVLAHLRGEAWLMDVREGFGHVHLPYALARKYPNADREWGWQYVFPALRRPRLRPAPRPHRHPR